MNGFRLTPGEPFVPSAKAWNRAQEAADVVFGKATITGVPQARPFAVSSGGKRVLFQCVGYDPEEGVATCVVLFKTCGGDVPDIDDLNQIEVSDPSACYFAGEDEESLPGRRGWADYMESINPTAGSYNNCFWAVSALCCQDMLE